MIGDPVKPAGHARGIYTIFPTRAPEKEWMSRIGTSVLHRDSQPFQLGIVVYLSDVEENDMGAYTVLPGSHVRVYHEAMASEYHSEPSADHNRVCKELRDEIEPQEILGKAGDVIFCTSLFPSLFPSPCASRTVSDCACVCVRVRQGTTG